MKMNLSEYLQKILKAAQENCTARIEFDIILDDKCQVNEEGNQKVHFEVMQLK